GFHRAKNPGHPRRRRQPRRFGYGSSVMKARDDLKHRIVQSGLLDREELDSLAARVPAEAADGDRSLLDVLVAEKRITEFEAGALAAGLTGPFMLGPYLVHEKIAAGRLGDLFRGR